MIDIGKCIISQRKAKGLLQKDLARLAGMCAGQLCQIESGRVSPTFNMVERLAIALGMDIPSLISGVSDIKSPKVVSQTSLVLDKKKTVYVPIRAIEPDAELALRLAINGDCERDILAASRGAISTCLLALNRANLKYDGAGASLAETLRLELGLGTAAAIDLQTVLEFRGFRMQFVKLPKQTTSVSFWNMKKSRPLIVFNSQMTIERLRYRMAYELGSICLFVSLRYQRLDESLLQHRFLTDFTASFLMPSVTVREYVVATGIGLNDWTFDTLVDLKSRFGVSAESFALRLEELGLISPSLRLKFRDQLRIYYKKHSKAMEPISRHASLCVGMDTALFKFGGKK